MTTLVVAAHPDDEILGCGATMARLAAERTEVHILILGEGATSRAPRRDLAAPEAVNHLADSARAAAEVVGASSVQFGGLPDNRFDEPNLLDIVHLIENVISAVNPSQVLTHHRGDLNIDHRRTHEAVLAATRPQPGSTVTEVLAFEVLSSTEWMFNPTSTFNPTVFIDVSDHFDKKLAALRSYQSEMRTFPHPRSDLAVSALATVRGSTVGVNRAEAFQLVRQVR